MFNSPVSASDACGLRSGLETPGSPEAGRATDPRLGAGPNRTLGHHALVNTACRNWQKRELARAKGLLLPGVPDPSACGEVTVAADQQIDVRRRQDEEAQRIADREGISPGQVRRRGTTASIELDADNWVIIITSDCRYRGLTESEDCCDCEPWVWTIECPYKSARDVRRTSRGDGPPGSDPGDVPSWEPSLPLPKSP